MPTFNLRRDGFRFITSRMIEKRKTYGFTLVEMSIVLVIIGLIVSAVFVGTDLIRSGERRKILVEVNALQAGISGFYEKYKALPGDLADQTVSFGVAANGNSNGQIEWRNNITCGGTVGANVVESAIAWKILQDEKYISTSTALSGAGDNAVIGVNVPEGLKGGYFLSCDLSAAGIKGTYIGIGNADGGLSNDAPVFDGIYARAIDAKIDDGLASLGFVRGYDTANCWSGGTGPDYSAATNANVCSLQVLINIHRK
jgi:prepilin-type N-terminal cleavage/methylation domain-containing protein